MAAPVLRLGTRTSRLAHWQTEHVIALLSTAWPGLTCVTVPFVTKGDKTLDKPLPEIGGKGLFTAELEAALKAGEIDLAVHSLKDLPVDDAPGLTIGAIPGRADVRDAVVAADGIGLASLPQGAVVGTSSVRRRAQLLAYRPDLDIQSIRGNVETRIRKVADERHYSATILAMAGLERLALAAHASEILDLAMMLPAPGQGALAIQCRHDDEATLRLLAAVDDAATRACVTAERVFLGALGGGCSAPIAAHAIVDGKGLLSMSGLVGAVDGSRLLRVDGRENDPHVLGATLAEDMLAQGASALLQ
jgi:hydroxymethylbilane synthase